MTAPARLNILFVDDDPLVLQGLQRMLRPMRNEWAMTFIESGAKALQLLEGDSFDVIVSDMRMPAMNGAQLLSEVKNRHPRTVRLILSGHADKELILQCIGSAHQFLVKPCDPETLRTAIARASTFSSSAKSEQIRKFVARMDRIPTVPGVYSEMVEKLKQEDVAIDDIGSLIEKDPAITAKLLKLVNSAFFGLCREVSSPSEAAAYLGIDTMKALVLGVNAFQSFEGVKIRGLAIDHLWSHSLEVASVARKIVENACVPRVYGDESFVAGMLHDIGKLVLATNAPAEYEDVLGRAKTDQAPLHQIEEEVFGANHADVAGLVLSLWGLPGRVVEAIAHHHDPAASGVTGMHPVIAVHLGNAVVHDKEQAGYAERVLNRDLLESIGVQPEISEWMELAI